MTPEIFIKRQCSAHSVEQTEVIQSLWSGYGDIARYSITGSLKYPTLSSVVVKHCFIPDNITHPRGWQSDHAHQRKIRSYEVEQIWYKDWSHHCRSTARVAKVYGDFFDTKNNQRLLLLEDLDAVGYSARYESNNNQHMQSCINWLAAFHATFIHDTPPPEWPELLWKKGTYWHLDTRQDEWSSMPNSELKKAAFSLSKELDDARFKTLVHGDAKVANFCFSIHDDQVAAVDFQYIGGGVGVQDLVYLLGSGLSEHELSIDLSHWLDYYFAELGRQIMSQGESQAFVQAVIEEWEGLFLIAWADFHRFIIGWSPTHHKNTRFSQQLVTQTLKKTE